MLCVYFDLRFGFFHLKVHTYLHNMIYLCFGNIIVKSNSFQKCCLMNKILAISSVDFQH